MSLTVEDVANYVRTQVHYKPEWVFHVMWAVDDHVRIQVQYLATNSDRDNALEGYPRLINGNPIIVVECGNFNTLEELDEYLFTEVALIEIHEAREFWRPGSLRWAPYHPHRSEGNLRFNETRIGRLLKAAGLRTSGLR